MNELMCEHPVIIRNPHLKDIILKNKNYTLKGKEYWLDNHIVSKYYDDFPYSLFSPKKLKLTDEELNSSFTFDMSNGEPIPLFYKVGCGKCVICREKKADEWACRAMCESQTSLSHPYFVTLTYNDLSIPTEGVVKKHVQNFLKRLRINVERYCNFKTNIRYYACAEYGKKFGRGHYHLLLFNLPLLMPHHVQNLVQKSWSYMVSESAADSLPVKLDKYGNPVYKYYDNDSKRWRKLLGYTHTKLANDGSTRYCMKYMRKDAVIPKGKNDVFFLSSRRGGLGSQWLEEHTEEFRTNYNFINIEFCDIWSGKQFTGVMPMYFKNKLYPTAASIIPKKIRDNFKLWNYLSNIAHSMIQYHYEPNPLVINNYPHLPYHKARLHVSNELIEKLSTYTYKKIYDEKAQQFYIVESFSKQYTRNKDLDIITRSLFARIHDLEHELLQFHYDKQLIDDTISIKRKRERYITDYIATKPQVTTDFRAWSIRRRRRIASYREVF